MEILVNIFKILGLIVGCLLLITIIISFIKTPFELHKKNKAKEELSKAFSETLNEISKELNKKIKEEKSNKTKKNTKDEK